MKTTSTSIKWLLAIVIIFSIIQILSCFKILNTNNSAITTTIERMKRSQPKSHYKVKCHQSGTGKKNIYVYLELIKPTTSVILKGRSCFKLCDTNH